jgi:predicted dehydrogenase
MQALEFDLHVLCEKPIATRSKEASRVLATAQRKGRVLFPCHNYQHAPVIQAVRNLLSQDTIGPVHLVTLDTFRNTHALGVAEWREHWRRERRWSGGGIAMDHGSHTFYLAFDWLESYPTAISASATRRPPFDTEDTLACQLTFPSGVAMARMTWAAGMRRALYTLHGPRGAISVDDDHIRLSTMSSAVPSKASNIGAIQWSVREMVAPSAWDNPGHPEWFVAHLVRFAQVLREGTCLPKETLDAWQCLRVIEAAYASSDEGSRTVVLPPTEDPRTWSMH